MEKQSEYGIHSQLSERNLDGEYQKAPGIQLALIGLRWQPGARYIELPGRKINIGSKLPVFSLQYIQGFRNLFGSDAGFSKWKFGITDDINLKLKGKFALSFCCWWIFRHSIQWLPDYNHFNGNISTLATDYLNSFQLLPIYQFSNTSKFFSTGTY